MISICFNFLLYFIQITIDNRVIMAGRLPPSGEFTEEQHEFLDSVPAIVQCIKENYTLEQRFILANKFWDDVQLIVPNTKKWRKYIKFIIYTVETTITDSRWIFNDDGETQFYDAMIEEIDTSDFTLIHQKAS